MASKRMQLQAEPRSLTGKKVGQLRRAGLVPANIFGNGESHAIQVPVKALQSLLDHGGRTHIIDINLEGGSRTALLKSYTRDPISSVLTNANFQAVSMTETIRSSVPIRFVGESSAVKEFDATITHPLTELKVEARASELPEAFEVDLSVLTEIGSMIKVGDIVAPEGVTILDPADQPVASAMAQMAEEVEEPAEGDEAAEATESADGAEAEKSEEVAS